jgi:uncharacterized membrane protein (DUF4010 family)
MDWNTNLPGLLTALGLGLMIGVVRERRHGASDVAQAGIRTHALAAVLGHVTWMLGPWVFVAALVVLGAFAVGGYLRSLDKDPGLTGEVALVVTPVLAALAHEDTATAAWLGVLAAVLLQAKRPLQRLSRELISERELQDALMIAAAALVIMPLLPATPVDPWGVLVPTTLWRIVVLVMAVGMLGHVAMRAVGPRWGLALAGFFAGFASSTAATASFGNRSQDDPTTTVPGAAAALLANLGSLLLFAMVVGAASPALLAAVAWPLAAGAAALLLVALACLRRPVDGQAPPHDAGAGAFKLSHALLIAVLIALVLLASALLRHWFGEAGVLVAAVLVALAELHSAAASVAQLSAVGGIAPDTASWAVVAMLGASALAKTVLALVSGRRAYGAIVGAGLAALVAATGVVTGLTA